MDGVLREDDLFEIQEELWDARPKWRTIGLGLKIRPPDLDVIDQNGEGIDAKFESMILKWLQNGKNCTWASICKILSTRSVGHSNLAEEIRRKKCATMPGGAADGAALDYNDHVASYSTSMNDSTANQAASPLASPANPTAPRLQMESETTANEIKSSSIIQPDMPVSMSPTCLSKEAESNPGIKHKMVHTESFMRARKQIKLADPYPQGKQEPAPVTPMETQDVVLAQTKRRSQITVQSETELYSRTGTEATPQHPVPMDTPPKIPNFTEAASSSEIPQATPAAKQLSLRKNMKLRDYQEELAAPGLQGKNYIFVVQTGTGKTLVAGYIIMHHLNKMLREGRKRKVVFVTPTRQLTFQQKAKLQEYVPGIRVVEITGANCQPMHPLVQSDEADVIVCTAGKLRRELKTKAITITDISLIVADECHHAGRPSNYSDIMEFYIRSKFADPPSALLPHTADTQLPQVVGLTASPGAGRGKSNITTVMEHQLSLCAIMDATAGIVTVRRNVAELESVRNAPKSYLEVKDERDPNEAFIQHVHLAVKTLEQYIGSIPCLVRGSSKYDTWLQNEKEAAENRVEDERERISVLDQMSIYSQCLTTYHDFRHEDAVSVLEEVEEFSDATPFEKYLFKIHKELMENLSRLPKTPNPLLVHMESVLLDQYTRCPQSKGIFFVRAVKHTRYVTNWIKSSAVLSRIIRVTPITGYSRAGGMDKSEQLRVLEGFRNETYNLLASTSVLEEGLDVPECNFVIRYQNVSDEIAQVQAKGRARAQDSRIYTVVSSDSNKDYWYLVQEEKQRLVEAALSMLKSLEQDIPLKQKFFIEERDRIAQQQRYLRSKWPDAERVEVRCKKCNVFACKGSDVFAYTLSGDDNPHHVVPSETFSNKYDKRKHDKPAISDNFVKPYRIFCRSPNCRSQWGVIAVWGDTGYKFPVLKCESFLYKYGESTRRFKKWKDIWFQVQSIQDWAEFEDDVTQ